MSYNKFDYMLNWMKVVENLTTYLSVSDYVTNYLPVFPIQVSVWD